MRTWFSNELISQSCLLSAFLLATSCEKIALSHGFPLLEFFLVFSSLYSKDIVKSHCLCIAVLSCLLEMG